MISFPTKPLCELCGEEPANCLSRVAKDEDGSDLHWRFVGDCARENEQYDIPFSDFFGGAYATVQWISQLAAKSWMDWDDFAQMMKRLHAASS